VKSHTTARFRKAFALLPVNVRHQARASFKRFQQDPYHPSLHFKQIHSTRPIYSARAGLGYRALAVRDEDDLIWFWIGSHSDYDRLLARL
jgi:hypothetical protein